MCRAAAAQQVLFNPVGHDPRSPEAGARADEPPAQRLQQPSCEVARLIALLRSTVGTVRLVHR